MAAPPARRSGHGRRPQAAASPDRASTQLPECAAPGRSVGEAGQGPARPALPRRSRSRAPRRAGPSLQQPRHDARAAPTHSTTTSRGKQWGRCAASRGAGCAVVLTSTGRPARGSRRRTALSRLKSRSLRLHDVGRVVRRPHVLVDDPGRGLRARTFEGTTVECFTRPSTTGQRGWRMRARAGQEVHRRRSERVSPTRPGTSSSTFMQRSFSRAGRASRRRGLESARRQAILSIWSRGPAALPKARRPPDGCGFARSRCVLHARFRRSVDVAIWIGLVIFPALSALDWVAYRAVFPSCRACASSSRSAARRAAVWRGSGSLPAGVTSSRSSRRARHHDHVRHHGEGVASSYYAASSSSSSRPRPS